MLQERTSLADRLGHVDNSGNEATKINVRYAGATTTKQQQQALTPLRSD